MYRTLKAIIAGGVATISLGLALPASAAFVGPYQLSNFALSAPGGGSVDLSGAPNSLVLTGSDNGSGDVALTTFSVAAASAGLVNFSFGYLTNDFFGGIYNTAQDPAGYVLNGVLTQLTADNFSADPLLLQQSGTASFAVNTGDVFGFYVLSQDSNFGAASLTVSNFNVTAVPEPDQIALFGIGLAAIVALRRRKAAVA